MTTDVGQTIQIKGTREGLLVTLGHGRYADVLAQLTAELAAKHEFLAGSRIVLQVQEMALTMAQLMEIQAQFEQHDLELWAVLTDAGETRTAARELGLATRLPGSQTDLDGNSLPTPEASIAGKTAVPPLAALFLRETLRSGRSVYHEGDVVILGDVNPGAEVIAGGNVIVWGHLRGLVHAGAMGDETAVICALALTPTQLRIADQIAIPPDDSSQQKFVPEQATIRDGQIVAIQWPERK